MFKGIFDKSSSDLAKSFWEENSLIFEVKTSSINSIRMKSSPDKNFWECFQVEIFFQQCYFVCLKFKWNLVPF